jgi:DNA-binding response OmpR family regulator
LEGIATNLKYLSVDSNIQLADSEALVWALRGIGMERVDTMTEAIQKLMENEYLYIGINGDAVDYMPLLSTMRRVTATPILIVTGQFTTDAEVAALDNGADLYARWHLSTEDNIASVLAHVAKETSRVKTRKHKLSIIICGNLLVIADYKMIFCNDEEIFLTAKEYGVLAYMLNHRNMTLSVGQIGQEAWNGEDVTEEAVWKTVERLRKRLADVGFLGGTIVNYRGMGYRFLQ